MSAPGPAQASPPNDEELRLLRSEIQRLKAAADTTAPKQYKAANPQPYDGKGSPEGFLTQARVYLRFQRGIITDEADKILAIITFLKKDALKWFQPAVKDYLGNRENDQEKSIQKLFTSYLHFEKNLRNNFGNLNQKRTAA